MYSAHDSRRAYNPYPPAPSSSQSTQLPTSQSSYFFPESVSYTSTTLTPQQPSRLASSSLASALDIPRTNRQPRPQGETSANGSRQAASAVVNNGPYLNQGALPSPKPPQVGARQNQSNTPTADTMLPQHNENRIVHSQQGFVYDEQALSGQQDLYMSHANTEFDYPWATYGDSMFNVDQRNVYTQNSMYEQPGPSGSAPAIPIYAEPSSADNNNTLLGFDSQATQGNNYPPSSWEGFGMLPPTTEEGYPEFSDLVAVAWPPQISAQATYGQYDSSMSNQGVASAGSSSEALPEYGITPVGPSLESSQLGQQHNEPHRQAQAQAPIVAPVDPPTTEGTVVPPMPDVQFAPVRGAVQTERRQNLQGGAVPRSQPGMIGAGPSSGYGLQDYFSHVSAGPGSSMLQNQSFFQVPQYGQPGIMESSSRTLAPPSQGQSAAHANAHFPETTPGLPTGTQADNTQRASGSENRLATGRRHTVAAPIDPDRSVQQRAQAVAGSSSAPSSPLENAGNSGTAARQVTTELTGPRTTTPAMSLFHLNDAMWAQANEYNRYGLVETYQLRHGRDPPRSMKIMETSALERNVVATKALGKAVAAESKRQSGEAGNSDTPGTDGSELQARGQATDPGANLVPARAGAEQALQSPTSPTSPDEIVTPRDPFFTATQNKGPEGTASASGAAVGAETGPDTRSGTTSPVPQASFLVRKLTPLLRHDGHLHPHVSGLGGLSEAYDGRSYLPDDAEPDPEKIPSPPPGARIGDHPVMLALRPHPLHVRGEKWHAVLNPQPPEVDALIASGAGDVTANEEGEEDEDEQRLQKRKQLVNLVVNKDEMGEGWGFVEGGSHGPGRGLGLPIPEDEGEGEGARKKRLKLSTDHKNPPKMACHFCRNRKIACGEGKSDDKTCNQCERRGIRCVFPTESRRGMRSRKTKSGHTVDGVPEALKDAEGYEDDVTGDPTAASSSTSTSSSRGRGKPRGRPRGSGRGRGRVSKRGLGRMRAVPEADETGMGEAGAVDADYMMDEEGPGQQVGELEGGVIQRFEVQIDPNDPLASLAAETRGYEQLHGQHTVFSSETTQFTIAGGHNLGPFTRHPLNRRP